MQMVETGAGIDWGGAEMLAMGSVLLEGHWVRLMGQDVERGTFSHRHAILYDYKTNKRYVPLAHLSPDQGHITITNSMLSELAVLGFEYGFTLGRSEEAGDVGGAVRRLRQRRPADHRSVHRRRRNQVADT